MQRIIYGAVAGIAATMAMTATMRRLFMLLDDKDRYPLPPREITENTATLGSTEANQQLSTIMAHFGFGALSGAIYGLLPWRRLSGTAYGIAVWAASYLGWIPAARILRPATRHPLERNLLMLAAHLVWGAALARGMQELEQSGREIFYRGQNMDAVHGDDPSKTVMHKGARR